jgi:hypothetical protein
LDPEKSYFNLDSSIDFSVLKFYNFHVIAFALGINTQTIQSFRIAMVGSSSMNQLLNRIYLCLPPFTHNEEGHGHTIDFV